MKRLDRAMLVSIRASGSGPARRSASYRPLVSLHSSARVFLPRSGPPKSSGPSNTVDRKSPLTLAPDTLAAHRPYPPLPKPGGSPGPGPPPLPSSYEAFAFNLTSPTPSDRPLDDYLRPLQAHLLTSFLPASDQALALLCPFEGGEDYVMESLQQVADHIGADCLRLDLALAIGLDGPSAPLHSMGHTAPSLPQKSNPLLQERAVGLVAEDDPGEEVTFEDDDTEGFTGSGGVLRVPLMIAGPSMPSFGPASSSPAAGPNEEWIAFFDKIINQTANETASPSQPRPRIIVLESTAAMASTFDVWWPSLLEAVRKRRKGTVTTPSGRQGRQTSKQSSKLVAPTSIVLSCTPSLLASHIGDLVGDGALADEAPTAGRSELVQAALEAAAERFGVGVTIQSSRNLHDTSTEGMWHGSLEKDVVGRNDRNRRRLTAIMKSTKNDGDIRECLPPLGIRPSGSTSPSSMNHPLLGALLPHLAQGRQGTDTNPASSSIVSRALPLVPPKRSLSREYLRRQLNRRCVSLAILCRAVHQAGGKLVDPLTGLADGLAARLRLSSSNTWWGNAALPYSTAQRLASSAIGRALSVVPDLARAGSTVVELRWQDIREAWQSDEQDGDRTARLLQEHLASHKSQPSADQKAKLSASDSNAGAQRDRPSDSIVDSVKRNKNLSSYERRLVSCIVDTQKLSSTSFDDVHLPDKTIDAIRTVVSLPLLFPEAFRTGLLRQHSTGGALLFGPPGTGKTLLARAVASESGAQMLAVQPSDVNNMYVGESEKLVKAVFSLARRLSPCVIFLDEVDALFGARASKDASGGAKAHNQVLTEFMQEMDGLSSAIANTEHRIIVIGATNRPFDLDDAILRRLPRRLLVDLPGRADRRAILDILLREETLDSSVDLDALAADTEGYSGSDLKYLCVSAALAAVKDSVRVPWLHKPTKPVLDESSDVSSSFDLAAGLNDDLLIDEILPVAPLALTPDLPKSLGPYLEHALPDDTDIIAERDRDDSIAACGEVPPVPIPLPQWDFYQSLHPHRPHMMVPVMPAVAVTEEMESQIPSPTDEMIDRGLPEDELEQSQEQVPLEDDQPANLPSGRVLTRSHFSVAMKEIRPSSTEEGTLPELRKWAEQFGEGGTRKGRKSGFGTGFGFGGDRRFAESGYGKVAQEE
ncbi:hypothetical protein TREMEDRAFT_71806 [Tremella mesenterica DSM 1558]|uniref:uncharacterized protein n=1 Tax=Tremella mesenterica (strain ATCC 24925 / CBS 8224 / DSM 1558 / NBRC 9311 / NRRL Y-6157 / RJB 2259-6 / UBC 559-6) TaxID=578456 RepID=UPI0003F4969D|nr:uncharacterized protein TREMEDRAFT_71806 [Tremella mesenterica DSM 1558]EIW69180.1 hypothetical protein TREMEDRAFT_71806 [Tremella mesenterica DSM 1558]